MRRRWREPAAIAADWLVSAWDQNSAMAEPFPATTMIEQVVAGWVLELLDLPREASVGFVTGGQMANTACLAAARNRVLAAHGWDVEVGGLQGAPRVNVLVGAHTRMHPFGERQGTKMARETLDYLNLGAHAERPAAGLPFGTLKRIELARALVSRPRLLLLDEPAGGINPALLEIIIDRVRQLRAQGVTFLIVEHNMDVVMNVCDPVVVMAYGKFLAHGSPAAIQNDAAVLEAYLGVA